MRAGEPIRVTRSFLPPREEYFAQLARVWDTGQLTNHGPLHRELLEAISSRLELAHLVLTNNGTIPIQMALRLLAKQGEVITTPFSFVATANAIAWEGCHPVFVDIDPKHLTIDETKIEQAITPRTTAILATHVFGNPCAIEAIDRIAERHELAVIYDAAHAFDATYQGRSLLAYGDASTCSFHATKIFHTGEGGAFVCQDADLAERARSVGNFGFDRNGVLRGLGTNAKLSELQAAMGLTVLPHVAGIIEARRRVVERYTRALRGSGAQVLRMRDGTRPNYAYFPVLLPSEAHLLKCMEALAAQNVFPRRYFHPSLNTLPHLSDARMPVSEDVASRILCLPLYPDLPFADVDRIAAIVMDSCASEGKSPATATEAT